MNENYQNWAIFDLETDGLLDTVTTIHCMVVTDHTGSTWCYHETPGVTPCDGGYVDGLDKLEEYDHVVGHNIQGYDIPVLDKVGYALYPGSVLDTLILCRLRWPKIFDQDYPQRKLRNDPEYLKGLMGSHKLAAWGERMGEPKTEFDVVGLKELSQECLDYCVQDVKVNVKLWKLLLARQDMSLMCVQVEHEFAGHIEAMNDRGCPFDEEATRDLARRLQIRVLELDEIIQAARPPKLVTYFTPKRRIEKQRLETFNPGSRDQIAKYLVEECGWVPDDFTKTGRPKLTDEVMGMLPYPLAAEMRERFVVVRLLGTTAEGAKAWLKKVRPDGRIYGRVMHIGAPTSRCSHSNPNLANVPRRGEGLGSECRTAFRAEPGKKLIGVDASGLELRCLANRMGDKAFTDTLLQGDIHTTLQIAWGVDNRDTGKTMTYAMLYGGQDGLLGSVLGGTKADGKRARARLMENLPALDRLIAKVKTEAKRGFLIGLDGRRIPVRSLHSALNSQLQCDGAILVKVATNLLHDKCLAAGLVEDVDWGMVLHVHDEFQLEVLLKHVELVSRLGEESFEEAGVILGMAIKTAGEAKVGQNWNETH